MIDAEGENGPPLRVVALGGGHGLATSLQAVRSYATDITAIVSVADDGGSSGRLRAAFDRPAPGDVRRCLVALGDPDSPWTRAFEHRFEAGELDGHALGNLLIAGLAESMGDFTAAVAEAGRLVGAVGRVLPATTGPAILTAEIHGCRVVGQVRVADTGGPISRIALLPVGAAAPLEAVAAIEAADQVILGPGSLYTSVLAVTAVPALREALADRSGGRVYVCNLRPEVPETAGFDAGAHVKALRDHGVEIDHIVYDPAAMARGALDGRVVEADLTRLDGLAHDPRALGSVLRGLAARGSYRLR